MLDPLLRKVTAAVHHRLLSLSSPTETWDESLQGACALGASVVYTLLKQQGVTSQIKWTDGRFVHYYVSVGSTLCDPTIKQFRRPPYDRHYCVPDWYVGKVMPYPYETGVASVCSPDEAVRNCLHWTVAAQPFNWLHDEIVETLPL